jgi:Zn-dependent protease with chaperone function
MIRLLSEAALQLSVGPIRDLWPLLLVPAAAALVRDRLVVAPAEGRAGSAAQGALVAAPGALALALIVYALIDSFPPDKALRWSPAWMLAPALGLALLAFMAVRVWRRMAAVRGLFRASVAPRPALATLARQVGVQVREIDSSEPACFLAGFLRPAAFISSSVLDQLSEAELVAALMHERAHARAFDTLRLLILSALHDLRPMGGRRAMGAFLAGLERLADARAIRACAPADLAAAIVRLRAPPRPGALVLSVADAAHVRWRLSRLLAEEPSVEQASSGLVLGALLTFALLAWPAVQLALHHLYCSD